MPGHRSVFWKLALLLSLSAVLTVALSWTLTREVADRVVLLGDEAKTVLRGYAGEAYRAWRRDGEVGVARWLDSLGAREPGDAMVVDGADASLSGRPLTEAQRAGLRFQRQLDWRMSFRMTAMPYIGVPFAGSGGRPAGDATAAALHARRPLAALEGAAARCDAGPDRAARGRAAVLAHDGAVAPTAGEGRGVSGRSGGAGGRGSGRARRRIR